MSAKSKKTTPLKTILVIVVGLMVVYIVTDYRWALISSLVVGVLGAMSDWIAEKIDFLWMKLSWILGLIVPNIILSVIFFLFLTPIALLSRIIKRKDPLSLKNSANSLFKDSNKHFGPSSFERPW
jgi:hypothetical protein